LDRADFCTIGVSIYQFCFGGGILGWGWPVQKKVREKQGKKTRFLGGYHLRRARMGGRN